MSKYDIDVGEAFPLDESQSDDGCRDRHGRDHCHRHDHDDHHHGRHRHGHHHAHMAALAMLFALKAYRHHMRRPAEQQ